MVEQIIRVVEHPLPVALVESPEYRQLSSEAQRALLQHVRYLQELPYKLREWLDTAFRAEELEPFVERLDLDLMINLGVTEGAQERLSPWIIQVSWVTHARALTSFLERAHLAGLNEPVPDIGAELGIVENWVRTQETTLQGLLDSFFNCTSFDAAVAHLIAIYTCLAGLKFGLSRVRLQYPR